MPIKTETGPIELWVGIADERGVEMAPRVRSVLHYRDGMFTHRLDLKVGPIESSGFLTNLILANGPDADPMDRVPAERFFVRRGETVAVSHIELA